ncbi:alpha/beta hydrolase [Larkinella knui]|uniref:Alpha/beta hydrolase n=1 Tax=Larkinella knui TaxID=2025310 RepID=A0A3P1CY47_9BACT|nr:alpha/beta hydrolase [Larkinella knui]RRB18088.1 alpha/beta hydrolase [Larkinella knui]
MARPHGLLRSFRLPFFRFACVVLLVQPVAGQVVKKHRIPIADSKLYVEESGKGPALLLLHGGMIDHRMWENQVAEFRKYFRVLNCDMRKHGLTQDGDSTFYNASAIALILDSFGIAKAHVMGLSLGAVAATDFVLAHPQRVDKLILAAPGLIGYDLNHDSVLVANTRQQIAAYQRRDTVAFAEYFVRSWTDPRRIPGAVDPKVRGFVLKMVRDNLKFHRWNTALRFDENPPASERLSRIQSPTLVLVGDLDMVDILSISDKLKRHIPNVKKVVIPNAAHMLNLEQPVVFNREVKNFLLN